MNGVGPGTAAASPYPKSWQVGPLETYTDQQNEGAWSCKCGRISVNQNVSAVEVYNMTFEFYIPR